MNKSKSIILILLAAFLPGITAIAQQQDSLGSIRTLIRVCNVYKELPLQLGVRLQHSANYITSPDDTMHIDVKFYLQREGSYVSFGELEQVANDSLLLLVSNSMKRMIVYPAGKSVAGQFRQYMGLQLNDSSLLRLAAGYTASILPEEKGLAGIELKSRLAIPYTTMPKELIRVKYRLANNQPLEITQTSRRLIPITQSEYRALSSKSEWGDHLLATPDSSYFLIKEQVSTYIYDYITHTSGLKLPVAVSDRIMSYGHGKFVPVKSFGDFSLTQNF